MDLSYGPEYEAFREEVRAFCVAHAARAPHSHFSDEARAWQRLLVGHGQ